MQLFKQKALPALAKFSLLALTCLSVAEIVSPAQALAGDKPVALPDSGSSSISDTFAPGRDLNRSVVAARIDGELASALQSIQSTQSVSSVGGRTLSLSPDQLAILAAAAAGNDIEALERQLIAEMGGLEIDVSVLEVSSGNLVSAVNAANQLVTSLDSTQLAAAIESPTMMALLRMLGAANQALSEVGDRIPPSQPGSTIGILQISLP
ncbi:MAG: hypothetical protein WA885_01465 [Phormidesmis sp.]